MVRSDATTMLFSFSFVFQFSHHATGRIVDEKLDTALAYSYSYNRFKACRRREDQALRTKESFSHGIPTYPRVGILH